jgi:hypothetical protein
MTSPFLMVFSVIENVSIAKPYLIVGITKGKEPSFERFGFSFFNNPLKGNSLENINRTVKPAIDNRGK